MTKNHQTSAYIKIIGAEHENDNTLNKCRENIAKYFRICDENQIETYSNIYLIAHGDDVSLPNCRLVTFGNNSPKQVCEIIRNLLKSSRFTESNRFSGKIILEGCHSAEPIPSSFIKQELNKQYSEEANIYKIVKNLANHPQNNFSSESSFLYLLQKQLKNCSLLNPEVEIGGYLGAAYDKDYSKTGFGIASTTNPATVKLQQNRNIFGEESETGGIVYNEHESHIQIRIGQHLNHSKGR
jgi:hypothetical protein